jgi:hypothetical protein
MAIKIGSTIVFNNSAQMSWNLLNSKPQIVSSLVKTTTGDNTNVSGAPAYDAVYTEANGRLQLVFNTNCACDCVCDCSGPMGCFLGSEYVLMADGTEKRLDQVRPGEWISCHFSGKAPVFAVRETNAFENKMFQLNNDIITTGEHAFWSPEKREWLVPDKTDDYRDKAPWRRVKTSFSGQQRCMKIPSGLKPRQMILGDKVLVGDRLVTINKINSITLPQNAPKLITLVTTTSMIIRGGWVVSGWSGQDFDRPIINDIDRRSKLLYGELTI